MAQAHEEGDYIGIRKKMIISHSYDHSESMINAGLEDGDLIVIDRSIEPSNNKIAVCFIEGEFTVKRLIVKRNKIWLKPENATYKPIEVKDDDQLIIWGIVTNVIKKL